MKANTLLSQAAASHAKADDSATSDTKHDLLAGSGEMARLIREKDWSQTPIGPRESWSPALRMMVQFLVANRFPLLLWWGSEYVSIYNDAYIPVLGAKHPWALGEPFREVWSEIRHILEPLIDTPFNGGPATWNDDIALEINRYGSFEETHFTIAYSPVPDETVQSGIGGVLATVHEITEKVIAERRVVALRDLGARVGEAKTAEEACEIAAETLAKHPKDVPFALLYLITSDGKQARLACTSGVTGNHSISPPTIDLSAQQAEQSIWPLAEVARTETVHIVEDLATRFGDAVPAGPWSDRPGQAAVVPIPSNVTHQVAGLLVLGISARLKFDHLYRSFFDLVASQIANAVANARSYEEERKRAEALAEIDRAKTAFFSNVSHEFRTPLTLLLGPAEEALADSGTTPANRERMQVIHRNAERLQKLVNGLLDFSRIEAGRLQATYEETDLSLLTTELASVFRSAIEKAGLRFSVECFSLDESAYVDRAMWEKIVFNLLSNAFKFTFHGKIEVKLQREGQNAKLTVRDTGVGIPANELSRIFERFHRVEGVRGRTFEGSGIGLALVQELIKQHGGEISAESEVDRGSTFTVKIPLGKTHLAADRIRSKQALTSPATLGDTYIEEALHWLPEDISRGRVPVQDQGTRQCILIADDNADMRDYLQRLLSPQYEVTAVNDGMAALDAAKAQPFDLVLADVMMPRLDGFGLLRGLRENGASNRTVPIILLSARAGEEARVEGIERGADDYLIKPFSARELLARVATHLELKRVRDQAAETLRVSEARFRELSEHAVDGIFIAGRDGRYLDVNPAGCAMLRMTREEVLDSFLTDIVVPEEHHLIREVVASFADGAVHRNEWHLRRKDGSVFIGEIAGRQLPDGRLQGVLRDMTERKQAETLLEAEKRVLELIAGGAPLPEVLDALVREVEANSSEGMIVSVLLTDEKGERLLHGAAPNLPEAYNRAIDGIQIGPCVGSCGTAAYRREPVSVTDIANDPLWAEFKDLAVASGLGACCSTPIISKQGRLLGTLAMYYRQPHVPGLGERKLIERASHLAAIVIERERTEEALRRTEEEIKIARDYAEATLRTSPVPLLVLESDLRVKTGNESFYKTFEVLPSETVGRLVYELGNGQWNIPKLRELLEDILPKHTLFTHFEVTHEFETIGLRTMLLNARRMENESGVPERVVLVIEDITRRKHAEVLADSQRQALQLLAEGAELEEVLKFLVAVVEHHSRKGVLAAITLLNEEGTHFQRGIGTSLPESLNQSFEGVPVNSPTGLCAVAIRRREAVAVPDFTANPAWQPFGEFVAPYGLRSGWSIPIFSSSGRILGTFANYYRDAIDPTPQDQEMVDTVVRTAAIAIERKQAEQKIHESEERFRTLADNMSQLAWACDRLGNVTWYNQRWYDYTGTTFEEMKDWGWRKVHHPDHEQRVVASVTRSRESGEVWEDTFPLRSKNGEYRWFLSRAIPIRNENGNIVRWFGTNTDVEDQRCAEEALRRSEKVAAVGRMAATMAHEVNNPLESVTNLLYLARKDSNMSEQTRQHLLLADQELDRVAHITKQTLGFYRDTAASILVNVSQTIDDLLEVYSYRFRNREIELEKDLDPSAEIVTSVGELRQVFSNLFINAVDATPTGGRIRVRVRSSRDWNGSGRKGVRITVADTGCGIDPAHRTRIFDAFYTTKQEIGTGLGLWLSRGIVQKHGGHIKLHSRTQPGESGTVFSVFWPDEANADSRAMRETA